MELTGFRNGGSSMTNQIDVRGTICDTTNSQSENKPAETFYTSSHTFKVYYQELPKTNRNYSYTTYYCDWISCN